MKTNKLSRQKENKYFLITALSIIVPIIIAALFPNFLTIAWTIFIISFLLIPIFYNYFRNIFGITSFKFKPILIAWLLLSLGFAIYLKNTLYTFIFGILNFILFSYGLYRNTINRDENIKSIDFFLICDFVISLSIAVYLIFLIEDEQLQDIIKTIIAALYGGMITLIGVRITIKHTENIRKNEIIEKNKPYVFVVSHNHLNDINPLDFEIKNLSTNSINFNKGNAYHIKNFYIKNVDYSYCKVCGFCINNDILFFDYSQCLEKNSIYNVKVNNYNFNYNKEINKVSLLITDMLGNYYIFSLTNKIKANRKKEEFIISITGGLEIKKVNINQQFSIIKD